MISVVVSMTVMATMSAISFSLGATTDIQVGLSLMAGGLALVIAGVV